MKNYTQLFLVMASVSSFGCMAQSNGYALTDAKMHDGLVIVSYHVEERINKPTGCSITTYNVSSLSLVNTNDLGQNNVRIVTPKYGKTKISAIQLATVNSETNTIVPKSPVDITLPIAVPIDVADTNEATPSVAVVEQKEKKVKIDVLGTYERIMDKGYKTVDMLIKVGNSHFFAGDLVLAAKWYDELFAVKSDLEAVYYYRYAQSLKAVNQLEKAGQMMKIFESKSL